MADQLRQGRPACEENTDGRAEGFGDSHGVSATVWRPNAEFAEAQRTAEEKKWNERERDFREGDWQCDRSTSAIHKQQLLTYLRLRDVQLGLLVNFNIPILFGGAQRVENNLRIITLRPSAPPRALRSIPPVLHLAKHVCDVLFGPSRPRFFRCFLTKRRRRASCCTR